MEGFEPVYRDIKGAVAIEKDESFISQS